MNRKIKVLMVDDERQFRATTEKILRRKGFETVMAASGEEAVDKLGEKPDVVILDIKMPGMDGHETLRKIKKRVPDLPVIMLTGHGAMPSAVASHEQGAFDYLSKPCDIDLLAAKIGDAYKYGRTSEKEEENQVRAVMVPIAAYTTIGEQQTVGEAILELKASFASKMSTSRIMETGHRSILVMDDAGTVRGILAIRDLLDLIMPPYLSAPKPSTADSIQYSPLFWSGMFSQTIREKAAMPVGEAMSPVPLTIGGTANLMEAAHMMVDHNARRLAVVDAGRVIGVIREQDLFFEMAKILDR